MAENGMLVDREDGSRFVLNFNKQTTENLLRSSKAPERLFGDEENLKFCSESEYKGYYDRDEPKRKKDKQLKADFVVHDGTKLIDLSLSTGFRLSKTVEGLGRYVKDCVWLLEKDTPIPAEFQVINGDNHVDILPDKRTHVTVEKFKEMLCCLNWVKRPAN